MGDTLPGQCGSLCAVEGVPCASLQIALDGASPFDLGIDQPADFPPVPNPGETLVLVLERGGERREGAERWWRHETGERVEVREAVVWALRFDPGGDAVARAADLAVTHDRAHGLFANPQFIVRTQTFSMPFLAIVAAGAPLLAEIAAGRLVRRAVASRAGHTDIDPAGGDGGTAISAAHRHAPADGQLRSGESVEDPGFLPDPVARGATPLRPIVGAGGPAAPACRSHDRPQYEGPRWSRNHAETPVAINSGLPMVLHNRRDRMLQPRLPGTV